MSAEPVDLLVTGGSGFLGTELVSLALDAGLGVAATSCSGAPGDPRARWERLDLAGDPRAVRELMDRLRPRAVVHTAAVDRGPLLRELTTRGAGRVAEAAAAVGARLVHLSSDVVYAGDRVEAYREDDVCEPVSPYGRAKADAERLVAAACPTAAVVRTSLILGGLARPGKHERMVVDACETRADVAFFSDEVRSPVAVRDLASAVLELAGNAHAGPINVSGPEALTRLDLARLVATAHGHDPAALREGRSADFPGPRPRLLSLDLALARRILSTRLRSASELLGA